jgi:hypothetical protein
VPRDLSAAIARFASLLRQSGLPVTLVEVTDAVRALDHLDLTDRHEFYLGLRAVFVTRPEEVPPFDRCFEAFWRVLPERDDDQSGFIPAPSIDDPGGAVAKAGQKREALALDSWGEEEPEEGGDPLSVPLASEAEGLVNQDFSTFSADQLDELLKLTIKIARRLAHRMSRRRRPVKRRGRVDLRRTLRANLTRGEIIELRYRERKRKKRSRFHVSSPLEAVRRRLTRNPASEPVAPRRGRTRRGGCGSARAGLDAKRGGRTVAAHLGHDDALDLLRDAVLPAHPLIDRRELQPEVAGAGGLLVAARSGAR